MKDTMTGALRECAIKLLDEQSAVDPDAVVVCAQKDHPEVFRIESARLVRNAAARIVKDILRELSADDEEAGQGRLPGLDLPTAIAVPSDDGGYVYVRSDKATMPELEAGEAVRVRNLDAAQEALDRYRLSVSRLRPFFKTDKTTTAQAYKLWQRSQKAAS